MRKHPRTTLYLLAVTTLNLLVSVAQSVAETVL